MNKYEILKDLIIPIISAIIGGVFTFLGVFITIKHEKRKEREEKILANKPLFYRIDSMQQYPHEEAVNFIVKEKDNNKKEWEIYGILKNTDNAILIIDSVIINERIHKSLYGDVIDKNQIVNLYIYTSKKIENNDNVILNIKDIMGNKYKYKLELKQHNIKSEIIGVKKLKNGEDL